jgi:hypothetical protein
MVPTWAGRELRLGQRVVQLDHQVREAVSVGPVVAVLFDPAAVSGKVGVFPNLIGVSTDGVVVWTAAVPTSTTGDCFVGVGSAEDRFVATSWSGWRHVIEPMTGAIVDREFRR